MVSRDWAEQHIHECIVGSPCGFCPAFNLGLRAISLIRTALLYGDRFAIARKMAPPPFPAALDCRSHAQLLHRARRRRSAACQHACFVVRDHQRPAARLCLFRG